ncbi:MAG: hypothetical protein PHW99_02680 [Rhodoferax sp.]|nr:hypothetical protein [Rhodoferax sp.]
MKHKASLWEGEFGTSRHITDVYWEGDITQQELAEVADQISPDWQTIDLELDPAHPKHGHTYRLQKQAVWPSQDDEDFALGLLEAEEELEGHFVWVHCCKHVEDTAGELVDEAGRKYRQVFNTVMFCVAFTSFDDIADQCDEHFGPKAWDAYELFLDAELPEPVATYG